MGHKGREERKRKRNKTRFIDHSVQRLEEEAGDGGERDLLPSGREGKEEAAAAKIESGEGAGKEEETEDLEKVD